MKRSSGKPSSSPGRPASTASSLLAVASTSAASNAATGTSCFANSSAWAFPPRPPSTSHTAKRVFAHHTGTFEVTLEAGGWEVIKRYVSLGQGISIVTDVCITDEDRAKMNIIPVGQYFPKRSYGIVTRNGKFLSAPSQRFIDIMNTCFNENSDVL